MKSNPRILIAEPSRYHALLINRELLREFPNCIVTVFNDGLDALDELRRAVYNVAVIADSLTNIGGSELTSALHHEAIDVPMILVSPEASDSARISALKAGAAEYVVRDDSYHLRIPRIVAEVMRNQRVMVRARKLEDILNSREGTDVINIMAATLAHEINNPLMTILGITELLLGRNVSLDPELSGKISMIKRSAKRIEFALRRLSAAKQLEILPTDSGSLIITPESRLPESTLG
jgi:signal transduction histidine kinase